MRKILLSMALLCSVSSVADEDRAFAESFLSAIYTENDAVYRSLLHSSLKQCANRYWSKQSGWPSAKFNHKISEVSESALNNSRAMAHIMGIDYSLPVIPTHEISIYWTDDNAFSEGHICHRKIMASFNTMLARDDGDWKIADVCFTEDDVQRLAKQRQDGDRELEQRAEERQRTVDEIYRNLSAEQRERLNSMLGGHIAYIILAYSEELSVDQDTAYDLLSKMCSEYSEQ